MSSKVERQDPFANVTRLTVVSGDGRLIETWNISNVAMALQDDGQTLKIFYREEKMTKTLADMTAKVERLQAAVKEMLYELHIYQRQDNEHRIRKEPLDTLETYSLSEEDME